VTYGDGGVATYGYAPARGFMNSVNYYDKAGLHPTLAAKEQCWSALMVLGEEGDDVGEGF
jgi:hypothetical protein